MHHPVETHEVLFVKSLLLPFQFRDPPCQFTGHLVIPGARPRKELDYSLLTPTSRYSACGPRLTVMTAVATMSRRNRHCILTRAPTRNFCPLTTTSVVDTRHEHLIYVRSRGLCCLFSSHDSYHACHYCTPSSSFLKGAQYPLLYCFVQAYAVSSFGRAVRPNALRGIMMMV